MAIEWIKKDNKLESLISNYCHGIYTYKVK